MTPKNNGPRGEVVASDANDTILYALGLDIGSLEVNQGFQITYRFGNTGLFGKNGTDAFYLNVDTPTFIPEPGSVATIGLGLLALVTMRGRSRRNTAQPTKPD